MRLILETARMLFREMTADDLPLLVELDSDPAVMRFITKGAPTPRTTLEHDHLPRILAYNGRTPPVGFWAAQLQANHEFIGWFHLRPDKLTPEEMELGYRLKRSAWGVGLATEGARAIIEKALGEWGWPQLSARTLAVNLASQRVMQKAGMKFAHEFVYDEAVMPEWTVEERRAVKYILRHEQN